MNPTGKFRKQQVVFNISSSFKISHVIGQGAYGIVCMGCHTPTGTQVAIKKIEPFEKTLLCKRTLRELRLLKSFRNHENIIQLYDVQKPVDYDSFKEVYLILEYMPTDLHRVIIEENLSSDHVRYFTYQLLRGLKYIHSAGVIHRDLKPSNLLVNKHCDLKICDFGLSRIDTNNVSNIENSVLTEYVATRWYRAPEVMLSASHYSRAMDMWSVGCILAELLTKRPLFPGKDYRHQLILLFQFLGNPKPEDLWFVNSPRAISYIQSLPNYSPTNFEQYFKAADPLAINLLTNLLVFDPSKRLNVQQALQHEYFRPYFDEDDEPVCSPIDTADFHFDFYGNLTREEFKQELYTEVMTLNS